MEATEITGFILISMAGMLVMAIGMIMLYRISKKQLVRQFREKERLKAANQHQLLEAAIDTQERERKRIASELHDHIGSNLQALKLYLHQIPKGDARQIEKQSTDLLNHTIQDVKDLSHELMPASLADLGLSEAIQTVCSRLNASGQISCSFTTEQDTRLDAATELGLYRVVQELTSNTLQHARASKINITLKIADTGFDLIYEDNGIGVKSNGNEQSTGLGLKNIESRCRLINAAITTSSGPGYPGFRIALAHQSETDG